jgi:hypothetical protein
MWLAIGGIAVTVVGFVMAAVAVWQRLARDGTVPAGGPPSTRAGAGRGRKATGRGGAGPAGADSPGTLQAARADFSRCREHLEARFLAAAAASGKPRGLAWADCDFETPVVWARDRATGHLRGLVGLVVRFTAVEGGGMENNPNVSTPRAATAVFRWENGEWLAEGRTLFNLAPQQALVHFRAELEPLDLPEEPLGN